MKKVISFILMFVLMLSLVQFSLAEDDDSAVDNSERQGGDDPVSNIGRRIVNNDAKKINEKLLKVPDVVRNLKKMNAASVRKMINKEEAMELRERLRDCLESDKVECQELKKEAKLRAKGSLEKITERILNILQNLKEKIESADFEEKDGALNEINTLISEIEKAKFSINELTDKSTKEEIKNKISELKQTLREAQVLIKKYHSKSQINEQKLRNAINKFNRLIENIGNRLDKFEERGYDFSGLKEKLENAKNEIRSAENNLGNGAKEATLVDLREAHEFVINILKEFRAGNSSNEDDENDNDDSEGDETEDENEDDENETEDDEERGDDDE